MVHTDLAPGQAHTFHAKTNILRCVYVPFLHEAIFLWPGNRKLCSGAWITSRTLAQSFIMFVFHLFDFIAHICTHR